MPTPCRTRGAAAGSRRDNANQEPKRSTTCCRNLFETPTEGKRENAINEEGVKGGVLTLGSKAAAGGCGRGPGRGGGSSSEGRGEEMEESIDDDAAKNGAKPKRSRKEDEGKEEDEDDSSDGEESERELQLSMKGSPGMRSDDEEEEEGAGQRLGQQLRRELRQKLRRVGCSWSDASSEEGEFDCGNDALEEMEESSDDGDEEEEKEGEGGGLGVAGGDSSSSGGGGCDNDEDDKEDDGPMDVSGPLYCCVLHPGHPEKYAWQRTAVSIAAAEEQQGRKPARCNLVVGVPRARCPPGRKERNNSNDRSLGGNHFISCWVALWPFFVGAVEIPPELALFLCVASTSSAGVASGLYCTNRVGSTSMR